MLRDSDEKSKISDEFVAMNQTVDWQQQISLIAGPFRETDTKESWWARAARLSGLKFWHVKALYKGELKDPKYSVAFKILTAADKARIQEAQRNAAELANIYQSAAQALDNIDPHLHRGNIDALVSAARILGALNSSGTEGGVK
jgi:hypothetical protein